jgi:hypothetical protein
MTCRLRLPGKSVEARLTNDAGRIAQNDWQLLHLLGTFGWVLYDDTKHYHREYDLSAELAPY